MDTSKLKSYLCDRCCRRCEETDPLNVKTCLSALRLNVGSGQMLLPNHINFDAQECRRGDRRTDIIGWIEDLDKLFPENLFNEILCSHVIEHFRYFDAIEVLKKLRRIIKTNGVLVIECPDINGIIELHDEGYHKIRTERQLIDEIFGPDQNRLDRGNHWVHRSAWTQDLIAEEMQKLGFKIVKKGIGLTHGMGKRDLRVEGIK